MKHMLLMIKHLSKRVLLCAGCLLLMLAKSISAESTNAQSSPDETMRIAKIKAAHIFHLAKFTQWPEKTFKDSAEFINLCMISKDPVNSVIGRVADIGTIHGRTLKILFLDAPSDKDLNLCHVVHFGLSSTPETYSNLLSKFKNKPVLSINGPINENRNTVIQLIEHQNKFRVAVNMKSLRQSGLRLSSELLDLANIVED